jgi:hypothetical protein
MDKLTREDILDILEGISLGIPQREIAIYFGVHESTISSIKTGRSHTGSKCIICGQRTSYNKPYCIKHLDILQAKPIESVLSPETIVSIRKTPSKIDLRRAAGMCTRCGAKPPKEGKAYCKDCAQAVAQWHIERTCGRCGTALSADDTTRCLECRKEVREYNIQHTEKALKLREAGICPECLEPYSGETATCRRCRSERNTEQQKVYWERKEKGQCVLCSKKLSTTEILAGNARCGACRQLEKLRDVGSKIKMSASRQLAASEGLCSRCLKRQVKPGLSPRGKPYKYCEECLIAAAEYRRKAL